jgi:hypothetical protein
MARQTLTSVPKNHKSQKQIIHITKGKVRSPYTSIFTSQSERPKHLLFRQLLRNFATSLNQRFLPMRMALPNVRIQTVHAFELVDVTVDDLLTEEV